MSGKCGCGCLRCSGRRLSADYPSHIDPSSITETSQAAAPVTTAPMSHPSSSRSRGRKRDRQVTPENAEEVQIRPGHITMAELCRDLHTGKKSKREAQLATMDLKDLARKQREEEERIRNTKSSNDENLDGGGSGVAISGPQMRIVNGEIVLDTDSLQIDRHADADRNNEVLEEVHESSLTRRITSASFGKRTKSQSWNAEMTDLFYQGLRMFGTDFNMISKMFTTRNRRQIKLKFTNEERKNPERIKATLLGPREHLDMDQVAEMTHTVYDDPREIQEQLDSERHKLEQEHERERIAQDEAMRNSAADKPLPSIEKGGSGRKSGRGKGGTTDPSNDEGSYEVLGTID